jgi:hypothetical protein
MQTVPEIFSHGEACGTKWERWGTVPFALTYAVVTLVTTLSHTVPHCVSWLAGLARCFPVKRGALLAAQGSGKMPRRADVS